LVTGNAHDVEDITLLGPRYVDGYITFDRKTLSESEARKLFTELRKAKRTVVRHPDHHSYGVSQIDPKYEIVISYENDSTDKIYLQSGGRKGLFRKFDKASWFSGYTGFVISLKTDHIESLLDSYFQ
jgi:hypothetical protein